MIAKNSEQNFIILKKYIVYLLPHVGSGFVAMLVSKIMYGRFNAFFTIIMMAAAISMWLSLWGWLQKFYQSNNTNGS